MSDFSYSPSRRQLFSMIGKLAGAATMYQAMTSLGFAGESDFKQALNLQGAPNGKSIVILGAGLAGLTAAYELRKAGYRVKVLEYQNRGGGRSITVRGGDRYTEISGDVITCDFAEGNYLNPGPWRLPHHHYAVIHYCREFGVALEPFIQENREAYLHSVNHFNGVPQRMGDVQSDMQGYTSQLLAKSLKQNDLDQAVTAEDKEKLLDWLKTWGVLNANYQYVASDTLAMQRSPSIFPGGGLMPRWQSSQPLPLSTLLDARFWATMGMDYNFYSMKHSAPMFQPVGGMGRIGDAFTEKCREMITFNRKVTKIAQNDTGVTIYHQDSQNPNASIEKLQADYCICTIPLSVLSQLEVEVSSAMKEAIAAVPYETSFKVGLEFNRRFWEEDEWIYGGVSYTDMPINQISYPSNGLFTKGPAVLLGGYSYGPASYKFNTLTPQERIEAALAYGSRIHPQYKTEFRSGTSWAWHRVSWTLGCYGIWNSTTRKQYYNTLCQIDNRVVLAGEHCSDLPAWQEGAILSGVDTAKRLHHKILNG